MLSLNVDWVGPTGKRTILKFEQLPRTTIIKMSVFSKITGGGGGGMYVKLVKLCVYTCSINFILNLIIKPSKRTVTCTCQLSLVWPKKKGEKKSYLTMCPYFCKNQPVVIYLGNSGMSLFLKIFLPFVPIF